MSSLRTRRPSRFGTLGLRLPALRSARSYAALAVGACVFALGVGCGGGARRAVETPTAPGGSKDPSKWPADDRSMCNWRSNPELEVIETMGPGALKPNVRRVYKVFGDVGRPRRVLVCREIDTNLDGIKDVVRTYDDNGQALHEEADTDYDGKVDVWVDFVDGRISQAQADTNKDGRPDVWKFYGDDGKLQRVRRDRNGDGKPDVWEFYSDGRLERVGVDETFDGKVDRWDRDAQLKQEAEAAERRELAAAEDAGAPPSAEGSEEGPER